MPSLKRLDFDVLPDGRQGLGARPVAAEAEALIGPGIIVRTLPTGRIAAYRNGRLLASADAPEDLARLCEGM